MKGHRMVPKFIEFETLKNATGPGAKQFFQTCSQCHGLPDPKLHEADAWNQVVERMLMIMDHHGVPIPDEKAQAEILDFLKTGSK